LNDENLNETFGDSTRAVRDLTEAMLELEKVSAMKQLRETLSQLRSDLQPGFMDKALGSIAVGYGGEARAIGALAGGPAPKTMEDVMNEAKRSNFDDLGFQDSFTLEVFEGITAGIDQAANQGNYEAIADQVKQMMRLAFGDVEGYNEAIDGGGAQLLATYAELAIKTAEMAAALDGSAEAAAQENERRREYNDLLVRSRELMGEFVTERVAQEKKNQEDSDRFISNYISKIADRALAEVEAAEKTAAANKTLYDVLEQITGLDITQVFDDGSSAADKLLAKVNGLLPGFARLGALAAAYGEHGMGNVLGIDSKGNPILKGVNTVGGMDAAARGAMRDRPNPFGSLGSGAAGVSSGSAGGGGGGGGREQQDLLEKLMEQITLEKELLGLTEAQQRVRRALGEDREKHSEAEINAVIKEIEAMEAKKRSMEQTGQIARTIEQAMGDAFTSMVDGTKSVGDAFKDMARLVVNELFQVLVVQQLVGTWNSSTGVGSGIVGAIMGAFQADGGAWQNGNQVQAFADGGVVNRPTFFGMSGGRTGLMGEAGPEAIMPLKRGSDGKLGVSLNGGGGGDAISISNVINVSGNNDPAAVRNEIAKALPQIVEATKGAIIQARQRGGEMRRTFGSK
jgi:phage-related minor tail protein